MKMYKILLLLFSVSNIVQAQENPNRSFNIVADVQQVRGAQKFYIYYTDKTGKNKTDSAKIENGKVSYTGMIEEPTVATIRLTIDEKNALKPVFGKRNMLALFLAPGSYVITAKDWLSDATISGSVLQTEYMNYKEQLYTLYKKMEPLNLGKRKLENKGDFESLRIVEKKLDSLAQVEEKYMSAFVRSHPSSPVALIALTEYTRSPVVIRSFKEYFELLDPQLQQTSMGQKLKEKLQLQTFLTIGTQAPNFSQPDTSGQVVQLKDFRGKYIFVDFWASWCGPCRLEIPFIKKAFARFQQKNFQILSVSIDSSREKWLKAIKEDSIGIWPQVGDMLGNKNAASNLYKIRVIPQNLLIDPNGKIIAKNLYGLDLERILEKTLN